MNAFVDGRWIESVHRLALGLAPLDALRALPPAHALNLVVEEALPAALVLRRPGSDGRHALLLPPGRATLRAPFSATLRLFDQDGRHPQAPVYDSATNRRRLVPRRLRVTVPAADAPTAAPRPERERRAALFPGAAYDLSEAQTGLRGRVLRGGVPVRWARVEARRPGGAAVVARAHGDERGEFLLLLPPAAMPGAALDRPFELDLLAFAPLPPAPLPAPAAQAADPLWDLPVETLAAAAGADPVADGTAPWAGWTAAPAPQRERFVFGTLRPQPVALAV